MFAHQVFPFERQFVATLEFLNGIGGYVVGLAIVVATILFVWRFNR